MSIDTRTETFPNGPLDPGATAPALPLASGRQVTDDGFSGLLNVKGQPDQVIGPIGSQAQPKTDLPLVPHGLVQMAESVLEHAGPQLAIAAKSAQAFSQTTEGRTLLAMAAGWLKAAGVSSTAITGGSALIEAALRFAAMFCMMLVLTGSLAACTGYSNAQVVACGAAVGTASLTALATVPVGASDTFKAAAIAQAATEALTGTPTCTAPETVATPPATTVVAPTAPASVPVTPAT